MNQQFTTSTPDGCFATAVVATFFAPTNRLAICNAGHPPPLRFRAETGEWLATAVDMSEEDPPRNVPLGILERVQYCQIELKLMPGDLLLSYTDALSESRHPNGELLGTEGLLDIIRRLDVNSPQDLIPALLNEIAKLDPANLQKDDVTALLMRPVERRRPTVGARLRGAGQLASALARATFGRDHSAPLPDLSIANVGGAILPPLGRVVSKPRRRKR